MGSAAIQAPFAPPVRRRCCSSHSHSQSLRRPFLLLTFATSNSTSVRSSSVRCSALTSPSEKAKVKESRNYDQVAEQLENIYRLSPARVLERIGDGDGDGEGEGGDGGGFGGMRLVRGKKRKAKKRLTMEKRAATAKKARSGEDGATKKDEYVERLLRENLVFWNLGSLDWKRMKIPPVLRSAEQTKLVKLMQPMKAINEMRETLRSDLQREPSDGELAARMNMTVHELRRHIKVGEAARNKLIKHNLRLVIFVVNKYFAEFATNERFDDLCQAGFKGLVIAIDRFEPKRGRISTYSLFWIRHSIIRSMTKSSLIRYPLSFESLKQEIQKAKLNLLFELGRTPTEEEIAKSVGITLERYQDVMKAMRPIHSLNVKHPVTQEELINGISDSHGFSGDTSRRQSPALLRLAIDDVLDSLKPKESIVIRQRYGLDGKGERSLAEVAGNLNISREMVRKHELKAFMKLKHPTRLDYLRKHL